MTPTMMVDVERSGEVRPTRLLCIHCTMAGQLMADLGNCGGAGGNRTPVR